MAWYCAVKLEMATALTAALLTVQLQSDDVPGLADAQQKLEAELVSRTGLAISVDNAPDVRHFGEVDDWYATYEWSDGGIIHAHMAFWVVGAPRIDKVEVPREQEGDQAALRSTRRCRVNMLCRRQKQRSACSPAGIAPTPNTT